MSGRRGERGAGLHVIQGGRTVVDLYGGVADDRSGLPYDGHTRQVVFSASKGVVAVGLALLVQRGDLDLDSRVTRYWPEFGRAGKGALTVAQLLSHRAGLPTTRSPVTLRTVLAGEPLAEILAAQEPLWRSGHGYHAVTWGTLAGELVRRVTGARLGTVLEELVTRPLGLDLTLGHPDAGALAPVVPPHRVRWSTRLLDAVTMRPGTLLWRAMTVEGALTDPAAALLARADVLAAELPAANVVTTARSLARLYAALLPRDDASLLSPRTLAAVTRPRAHGRDRVLGIGSAFGCGFALPSPAWRYGSATAFGHPGVGGALAFADPRRDLALAFLPRTMPSATVDPRATALVRAVAAVVGP